MGIKKFLLSLLLGPGLLASAPARANERVTCTVVADVRSDTVLHRQGICDKGFYPQSTFKFPLAIMGFDAGVLKDERNPVWPYKAEYGGPQRVKKAFDPTSWEHDSVLWYSQEITRRLGKAKFSAYMADFAYGNGDISGTKGKDDGLTRSWVMSSLTISPDQQVKFIRRFLNNGLKVSPHAVEKTMAIIPRFQAADGWLVQGKTGSGWLLTKAGKVDYDRPLGWFVGWAQKGGRQIVFARMLADTKRHKEPISFSVRDGLIADLAKLAAGFTP